MNVTDVVNATHVTRAEFDALVAAVEQGAADLDAVWVLLCGCLVVLMQVGFAMLEAGSVRSTNIINILLKNCMDMTIGAVVFWAVGFAFAFGDSTTNEFIGHKYFFLTKFPSESQNSVSFFFQWAFTATAATIISGSVAERCRLRAYFVYSIVITGWVYPVVVHWGWSGHGFLSAFREDGDPLLGHGLIDFAGSMIVHASGGIGGLCGAIFLGPRLIRKKMFDQGNRDAVEGHNKTLIVLGGLILWVGWYGFNPGSTLAASGGVAGTVAADVAVNTTLGAAGGALMSFVLARQFGGSWTVVPAVNGFLAGLVSITAPCSVVEPWAALLIGLIGGAVYTGGSRLLARLGIDDPLDASPVHLGCGIWGTIAVGFFATRDLVAASYVGDRDDVKHYGLLYGGGGEQLAMQLVGVITILVWVAGNCAIMFGLLSYKGWLRLDEEAEVMGADKFHHGGSAIRMEGEQDDVEMDRHFEQSVVALPSAEVTDSQPRQRSHRSTSATVVE